MRPSSTPPRGRGARPLPHDLRGRLDRDRARSTADGHTLEANPAMERMLGYTAAELADEELRRRTRTRTTSSTTSRCSEELMAGERDSYQLEKRCYRKDGKMIWSQVTAVLERDDDGTPPFVDLDDRGHHRAEGAPRRSCAAGGAERAPGAARRAHRASQPDALRDRDRAGDRDRAPRGRAGRRPDDGSRPLQGDQRLARPPRRRRRCCRRSRAGSQGVAPRVGHVARLGGDEFGLLLPRPRDPGDVRHGDRARSATALEQPIVLQDLPLAIEASIGVALFPEDGEDVDTLLQHADVAMYTAKEGTRRTRSTTGRRTHYDPIAPDARLRAAPRDRPARARPLLPAEGDRSRAARSRPSRRCCAGTTRARPRPAGRVHPARAADGPDQAAHAVRRRRGAARSAARGRTEGLSSRSPSTSRCATCSTSSSPSRSRRCSTKWEVDARAARARDHRVDDARRPGADEARSSSACPRWGSASRSTTSAPATRRSPT